MHSSIQKRRLRESELRLGNHTLEKDRWHLKLPRFFWRTKEFYLSGEPERTANYPLQTYYADVEATYLEDGGEYALFLRESVTAPGQLLIVENTEVSCACLRNLSPHSQKPSLHALTTVLSPDRIPPIAHQHLAHKFAEMIPQWEAAKYPKDICKLDARQHQPADGNMNPGSSRENRGPWNEVKAGAEKTLDYKRVWNIIANNGICYKVRSKSQEEPSQVETCEFWGMWITPSFINHSCIPNCHAMRVGDAIIIRAAKPIAAGEELTLPYFDIFQPLCKRELAAQRWGFRCECQRCKFERSVGKPYEAVQEKIMNLEQQIQNSWTLKGLNTRGTVVTRLMGNLADQVRSLEGLEDHYQEKFNDISSSDQYQANLFYYNFISASFVEPYIALVVIGVLMGKKYEITSQAGAVRRTEKVTKLREVINSVVGILMAITPVHPGSLLGQEFYSILLEASNELIDYDLDENLTSNRSDQELFVAMANQFSWSYYGPSIDCFESMKYGMMAFQS